ncbi:hypothetical protein V6N13_024258 [Hibiscus sabdariffa]|uniref:Late embryogenesis abundant protein LEA-2 subgroup domain-containing protein n=1 Tax=Hibiscus sabdariffa TaxID=183260 RepID=A0ABR2BYF1_9ROSI
MATQIFIGSCNIPRIVLIAAIVAIAILLCSSKTFVPFIPYPQAPIIKVNTLLVSNFMVSGSNLIANWLANITIYNPNIVLSVHVKQTEASVLYKHDCALSLSSLDDFELDPWENKDVYIKFVTSGVEADQPIIEYPLLKEIEKDWRQGRIGFRIRLNAMNNYEIGCPGLRGRPIMMDPYSINLDVNVEDARRRTSARNEIYDIIGHIPRDGSWLIMVDN